MAKNIGRTVLGLFLLKGAVLGSVYLYNKYSKYESDFKQSVKKDLYGAKKVINDIAKQAKQEASVLKNNVIDSLKESKKEDKVVEKKIVETEKSVKKVGDKVKKSVRKPATKAKAKPKNDE